MASLRDRYSAIYAGKYTKKKPKKPPKKQYDNTAILDTPLAALLDSIAHHSK